MISAKELEDNIVYHLRTHSGYDVMRSYLGISQIVKCKRQAYQSYVNGSDPSDFNHRMCYVGYLFERDVLQRLREMRIAHLDRREVVAPFDDRVRGHIDGTTTWGDLLEIKSVSSSKFDLVCSQNRALHEHNDQVQMYMRYGGWKFAWIVYVNRETFEHRVIRVRYNEVRALALEQRAIDILACIDSKQEPKCECGYCEV